MELVNLNCIRKICFVKKQKTDVYEWFETVTFSHLNIFFKKAHVILKYSDSKASTEVRYFNSNKEAEEFFKKLQVFAHENNIPFINFAINE